MSHLIKQKLSVASILAIIFLSVAVQPAFAAVTPDFPSCLNPQVVASQVNNGTNHGVIGKSAPYSGTDSIYSLQNGNVLQCLCTVEGLGIQTNWLKASNLLGEEVNSFTAQGWTYVPTGATWGLEDVPYLAKNVEFSCKGSEQSSSSSSNNIQSVLGLASTGNAVAFYGFILAGLISFFVGLLLKKVSK